MHAKFKLLWQDHVKSSFASSYKNTNKVNLFDVYVLCIVYEFVDFIVDQIWYFFQIVMG